jgi:hypothetical protein
MPVLENLVRLVDDISRLVQPGKKTLNRSSQRERRLRAERGCWTDHVNVRDIRTRRPAASAPGADHRKRLRHHRYSSSSFPSCPSVPKCWPSSKAVAKPEPSLKRIVHESHGKHGNGKPASGSLVPARRELGATQTPRALSVSPRPFRAIRAFRGQMSRRLRGVKLGFLKGGSCP